MLDANAAAKALIAKEGYDPQFGARPLKRAVQEQLLNPLSMKLLECEFKPRDRIKVTVKNEELVFSGNDSFALCILMQCLIRLNTALYSESNNREFREPNLPGMSLFMCHALVRAAGGSSSFRFVGY
jgi:hypothetical protein